MLAFMAYQPKNGIHCSSRLRMKAGSENSCSSANVSHSDWCLEATSSAPGGIFSSPRYSTLMPQTRRSNRLLVRPQDVASFTIAIRGITSVGIAMMKYASRLR